MYAIIPAIIILAAAPINRNTAIEALPGGAMQMVSQRGAYVRDTGGAYTPIDQTLTEIADPLNEWDFEPGNTEWTMRVASDWPWIKIINADQTAAFEICHSTFGLHWITGSGKETSAYFLPASSREPVADATATVCGNAIKYPLHDGLFTTYVQAVELFESNYTFDSGAIAPIPAPTEAFSGAGYLDAETAPVDEFYVAIVQDVLDWGDLHVFVDGAEILDGSLAIGADIQFRTSDGTTVTKLVPGVAYRDVAIDGMGASFWPTANDGSVEPYRLEYLVDRIGNKIYIDVPYAAFIESDTVFVDPQYVSSQPDAGDRAFSVAASVPARQYVGGGIGGIVWGRNSGTTWNSVFDFGCFSDGTLDGAEITAASINLYRYDGSATNDLDCRLYACDTTTAFNYHAYASPYYWDPATGYSTYSHSNYNTAAWPSNVITSVFSTWYDTFAIPDGVSDLQIELDADGLTEIEKMVAGTQTPGFITDPSHMTDTHYHRFYDCNAATQADRPKITIDYTLPATEEEALDIPFGREDVWIKAGSLGVGVVLSATASKYIADAEDLRQTLYARVWNADEFVGGTSTSVAIGNLESTYMWDEGAIEWIGAAGGKLAGYVYCSSISYASGTELGINISFDVGVDTVEAVNYSYNWTYGGDDLMFSNQERLYAEAMLQGATQADIISKVDTIDALVSETQQEGNSIVCLDTTGAATMVVTWPNGVQFAPGSMLEITADSLTADITPAIQFSVKNNLRNALATFDGPDGTVSNIGSTTTTWTDAAGNTVERVRLRYTVTEADAEVTGGTGTITIDGSAITADAVRPIVGVNTLLTFPATWDDAAEIVLLNWQQIDSQQIILAEVDRSNSGDEMRVFKTSAEIDPLSGVYAASQIEPGTAFVPADAPACVQWLTASVPTEIQYFHYSPGSASGSPTWCSARYDYAEGVYDETLVVQGTGLGGDVIYWASGN